MALTEFEAVRAKLEQEGVTCVVLDDQPEPARPDAIFPNNWMSCHSDGTMVLYPMATAARRLERRPEAAVELLRGHGLDVRRTVDLSGHEVHGRFLEGTGSLVLDRPNRRAYAALGPRTHESVIAAFDAELGFDTLRFSAADRHGLPIYHTNVLLSLGARFAILCGEAVAPTDRHRLIETIEASDRILVDVSFDQMERFACNALELKSHTGQPLIALSSAALAAFTPDQRRTLESFASLVDVAIPTIERVGGGSVRCMIAEVPLPRLT